MDDYVFELFKTAERYARREPSYESILCTTHTELLSNKQKHLKYLYEKYEDEEKHRVVIPDSLMWVDVNQKRKLDEMDYRYYVYFVRPETDWFTELKLAPCVTSTSAYYSQDNALVNSKCSLSAFAISYRRKKIVHEMKKKPLRLLDERDLYDSANAKQLHNRLVLLFNCFLDKQNEIDAFNKKIDTAAREKEIRDIRANAATSADEMYQIMGPDYEDIRKWSQTSKKPNCINNAIDLIEISKACTKQTLTSYDTIMKNKVYDQQLFPVEVTYARWKGLKNDLSAFMRQCLNQDKNNELIKTSEETFNKKVDDGKDEYYTRIQNLEFALIQWIHGKEKPCYCGGCNGDHGKKPPPPSSSPKRDPRNITAPDYNEFFQVYVVNKTESIAFLSVAKDAIDLKGMIHVNQYGDVKETQFDENVFPVVRFAMGTRVIDIDKYNLWVLEKTLEQGGNSITIGTTSYDFDEVRLGNQTIPHGKLFDLPLDIGPMYKAYVNFPEIMASIKKAQKDILQIANKDNWLDYNRGSGDFDKDKIFNEVLEVVKDAIDKRKQALEDEADRKAQPPRALTRPIQVTIKDESKTMNVSTELTEDQIKILEKTEYGTEVDFDIAVLDMRNVNTKKAKDKEQERAAKKRAMEAENAAKRANEEVEKEAEKEAERIANQVKLQKMNETLNLFSTLSPNMLKGQEGLPEPEFNALEEKPGNSSENANVPEEAGMSKKKKKPRKE